MRTFMKIVAIVAVLLGLVALAAGMLLTQIGSLVEVDGLPFWGGDAGIVALVALAVGGAVLAAMFVVVLVLPLAVLVAGAAAALGLGLAVWVLAGVGGLLLGPFVLLGLALWWLAGRLRLG